MNINIRDLFYQNHYTSGIIFTYKNGKFYEFIIYEKDMDFIGSSLEDFSEELLYKIYDSMSCPTHQEVIIQYNNRKLILEHYELTVELHETSYNKLMKNNRIYNINKLLEI